MRRKLKPNFNREEVKEELISSVCDCYSHNSSIRAAAKELCLSPMKVRKILITAGVYSTELSTEIDRLYRDGKTIAEIAELLNMTTANVNAYLPYERIIYNMDERSVGADRQARYRERLRAGSMISAEKPELPPIERIRDKTLVVVVGKKLRRLIPADAFDSSSDPLSRNTSTLWGESNNGYFELHEPSDPDKNIWCAELTTNDRGKYSKKGIVLMSANCGFAVICPLPASPELTSADGADRQLLSKYRTELEKLIVDSIRSGLLAFSLPENRVLNYTDTVARVEIVKGRNSAAATALEMLIDRELRWKPGTDPLKSFNVRGNWTKRKYGNSGLYRHVDAEVQNMLELTEEEQKQWDEEFFRPLREAMSCEK